MSMRVARQTTPKCPASGRLDAVLRAGLNATAIGSYKACAQEMFNLLGMLKQEPSPTDEEFATAFHKAAMRYECGKFTTLEIQLDLWNSIQRELQAKVDNNKKSFPKLNMALARYQLIK